MLNTLDMKNPGTQFISNPATTAHPVDGAVVGKVCGLYGEAIGHPGLSVVDDAFVPGGSVGDVNRVYNRCFGGTNVERLIAKNIIGHSNDDVSLSVLRGA
jgi:cholesterol oxidase